MNSDIEHPHLVKMAWSWHIRQYLTVRLWAPAIEASNRWLFGVTPRLQYTAKKHCPSDETLNRGADSLWSLKNTNSPIGLWPSWPPNHPHICWLASSLCLLSTSKLVVVGVLAHYGCRHIIQVDAAHWWWMRRYPPSHCKALWVSRKALYKLN